MKDLDVSVPLEHHLEDGLASFIAGCFGALFKVENAVVKGLVNVVWVNHHWAVPWILRISVFGFFALV